MLDFPSNKSISFSWFYMNIRRIPDAVIHCKDKNVRFFLICQKRIKLDRQGSRRDFSLILTLSTNAKHSGLYL